VYEDAESIAIPMQRKRNDSIENTEEMVLPFDDNASN